MRVEDLGSLHLPGYRRRELWMRMKRSQAGVLLRSSLAEVSAGLGRGGRARTPRRSREWGRPVGAERPWVWRVGLVLAVALLGSGCAASVGGPGAGAAWPHGPLPDSTREWRGLAAPVPDGEALASASEEEGESGPRLRHRRPAREYGTSVGVGRAVEGAGETRACGGKPVPEGWPWLDSSEAVLGPWLECETPAAFVAMQGGVDMRGVVEALTDWDAVRLGALGPLRAEAAGVLNRKRAAFLVSATEKYGEGLGEVFALYVLHTAFDDEVRQVLGHLAGDKQLRQTLGGMGAVREELGRRGLALEDFAERAERGGDVLRGLGRAGRDALATSDVVRGARYVDFAAKSGQLPGPYQQALREVERAQAEQHYAPGRMAVGSFDALTFGVPLGFYHLVAGTARGAGLVSEGRYEEATRELAPAALLVGVYAGGKGAGYVAAGRGGGRGRVGLEARVEGLKGVVEGLEARLGGEGVRALARHLRASREGALLVCEGGEAAAVALYEARGEVGRAQAWLAEGKAPGAGPGGARGGAGRGSGGGVASLVDEAAGFTREVVEAKLRWAEREAPGARLSGEVAVLERQRPVVEAPPPVARGHALWGEYVEYWEGRVAQLREGQQALPPLGWEGYQRMRGLFARGLAFERTMVARLRADAALPRGQRKWLKDFEAPRIEVHVGVAKEGVAGLRYADVLVLETQPPSSPPARVESLSFKSRDLSQLDPDPLAAQMTADARAALNYYGGTLKVLRPGLRFQVRIQHVRLVYEGGALMPDNPRIWKDAVLKTQNGVQGVEVLFQ